MEKYSVVYIDDQLEVSLTKYLDKEFQGDDYEIECEEITFNPGEGYDGLLENQLVKSANIILIDSLLFENRSANVGKFTGEEFKVVFKKFFPFIEVLVITQNEIDETIDKIPKYDKKYASSASEYYSKILPKRLNRAVANIRQYRILAELVNKNNSWEDVIKQKIIGAINGTSRYDEFTKEDIDNLINTFKEIEACINE